MKSVAPNLRASASLAGCMSIAMIRPAPARRAPEMTLSPTPPTPITATVSPGFTAAVLIAAPAPVTHPQPRIEACGKGNSSGILASWFSCRSEEHTSELQSLMRISYAVFCLKKKKTNKEALNKQIQHPHTQNNRQHDDLRKPTYIR